MELASGSFYIPPGLTFKTPCPTHRVHMCVFLRISEQTAIIPPLRFILCFKGHTEYELLQPKPLWNKSDNIKNGQPGSSVSIATVWYFTFSL
jgi:hypothetical protein